MLYMCNWVSTTLKVFDPAEPMLIKYKMQHVIKSKGISKNNENSGRGLLEDDRICANDRIFWLQIAGLGIYTTAQDRKCESAAESY